MEGLTVNRNVHYVTEEGVHLAAFVVKVLSKEDGIVNLTVLIDHAEYTGDLMFAATSVNHSDEHLPNTWHFIERA